MNITINNIPVDIRDGESILEAARRMDISIPSLCYAKGAWHKSSCMVCAVRNNANGQIIPSCTTSPTEGMQIDTESEEVKLVRRLSLELLLSDHKADCEAPCSMVCPKGLDVEWMLGYYDAGEYEEAARMLANHSCDGCKAPCEKACRRGTIDKAVTIREIVKEVVLIASSPGLKATPPEGGQPCGIVSPLGGGARRAGEDSISANGKDSIFANGKDSIFANGKDSISANGKDSILLRPSATSPEGGHRAAFNSRLGRFTPAEKTRLQQTVATPSRCLHCACAGRTGCRLRLYATAEGIKRPRYEASSALPAMDKQHIRGNLWFEPAKCIRCGLCVYNSANGFTFKDRGFGMQIVLPEENKENINETLAGLCPTGAMYVDKR